MNLNEIITYCVLKDLIRKTEILFQGNMYGCNKQHTVVKLRITISGWEHINIIYRSSGGTHAALLYAEIGYSGPYDVADSIRRSNIKVSDIARELDI